MLSKGLPHGRLRAFHVISASLLPSPVERAWSTDVAFPEVHCHLGAANAAPGVGLRPTNRDMAPWTEAWHRGRQPESPIDTDNPSGRRSRNHDGRQFRFDF